MGIPMVSVPSGASRPASRAASASADPQVQSYMLGLLKSGTTPADVAAQTNKQFGLTTGGEAVYYGDTNTIGLPNFYLAGPTDKPDSPADWNVVVRGGGRRPMASASAPDSAASTMPPVPAATAMPGAFTLRDLLVRTAPLAYSANPPRSAAALR
jgi:hypothetical protein